MILGDPAQIPAAVAPGARMTLDDLFRRTTERSPQMIALIDPPNRASFSPSLKFRPNVFIESTGSAAPFPRKC